MNLSQYNLDTLNEIYCSLHHKVYGRFPRKGGNTSKHLLIIRIAYLKSKLRK